MSIDWDWGIFFQEAPFGNTTYLGWLISGFQVTVALSLCAWIIAFIVGSFFGILRTVPNRLLSSLGAIYVELFRNVPLIVQFFTWYLVIPELLPQAIGDWFKMDLTPNIQFFVSSALCLGLFTAARMCKQVRAAINSLPRGQKAAGLALGLTLPQTYRYVLLPNAYRVIIPPMTSEMLNLVKNSAIASTIGLIDMAAQANKLLDYSAKAYESFTAITLAYVFINVIIMLIMHWLEKRVRLPGTAGGQ
ncbi:amino acid ABC transporter permease [Proteus mirabilis]|uniref:amino acid ABC transporter permease n=1 Tax=Proteus mirabilis TaxID=584 RepID=UPI0036B31634